MEYLDNGWSLSEPGGILEHSVLRAAYVRYFYAGSVQFCLGHSIHMTLQNYRYILRFSKRYGGYRLFYLFRESARY